MEIISRFGGRLTLLLTAMATAVSHLGAQTVVAAERATIEGVWTVTFATSVRRSGGELEVLRRTTGELKLTREGDRVVGTLAADIPEMGPMTVHLEGDAEVDRVDLDPVGIEHPDGAEEVPFRGFYVNGTLTDGTLSGEMWGAVIRGGEERHTGPLPWEGKRKGG